MLGYEISIERRQNKETVATLTAAIDLAWLDDLVKQDLVKDLGGNGYPIKYEISVGVLLSVFDKGILTCDGPVIKPDDYWKVVGNKRERVNIDQLRSLDPGEILDLEAWDRS